MATLSPHPHILFVDGTAATARLIGSRGMWLPPIPFVFVRMPGWCTSCGERVRADSGYVLVGGGLGCAPCGRREGRATAMRQRINATWAKDDLLETIKRICTGGR